MKPLMKDHPQGNTLLWDYFFWNLSYFHVMNPDHAPPLFSEHMGLTFQAGVTPFTAAVSLENDNKKTKSEILKPSPSL